jgi:hypothetical protein
MSNKVLGISLIGVILLLLVLIIATLSSSDSDSPLNRSSSDSGPDSVFQPTSVDEVGLSTTPNSDSSPELVYPPTRPEEVEGGGYLGNPYDAVTGKLRTPDRCVRDTKVCPDGRIVTRKPEMYCQFSPCGE